MRGNANTANATNAINIPKGVRRKAIRLKGGVSSKWTVKVAGRSTSSGEVVGGRAVGASEYQAR
jgi:hypothetical protein